MKKTLFFFLLALAACTKTEYTALPAGASNGGESYLSCIINGKNYTFTGKPYGFDPTGVFYSYARWVHLGGRVYRDFSVSGDDIGKQHGQVYISLSIDSNAYFPLNQRIPFSDIQQQEVYVLLRSPVDFRDVYYYADPTTGWISISRADSVGAGTFGFTAYGVDHNGNRLSDSVIVTNGKFDIHN